LVWFHSFIHELTKKKKKFFLNSKSKSILSICIYRALQNTESHTTPDWKIHFGIPEKHIPLAWNIIAQLCFELDCKYGLKTTFEQDWPERQWGREITVYIFVYHPSYGEGSSYFEVEDAPPNSGDGKPKYVEKMIRISPE
jgi:hypothetical protein